MSFGVFFFFFFFKQKTAYEMRISDWSSDVCSSDLLEELAEDGGGTDHDRAPSFSASATTAGSSVARPASRPRLSAASSEQPRLRDRKSVVSGKSVSVRVDLGGRRIIKQKKTIARDNTR